MFEWIVRLLDRVFTVFCALLFAQFPLYIQQYKHRLSGHVDELQFQINAIKFAAKATGKTVDQYIQKFVSSTDLDFYQQGIILNDMIERFRQLSEGLFALEHATVLSRPFVFFFHLNIDIVKSTFRSFEIGLPLSLEGFVYALIGICFASLIFIRKDKRTY